MKAKLSLLETSSCTSQSSKPFQSKNKGLVAETFDWDEEEVFDDDETRVQDVNECLQLIEAPVDPGSSKDSGSEPQTPLPPLKNLHGATPSSEPETKESSNKNVSGPVTVCNAKPVTALVPTEVKTNDQESKINELTKLVQMLMDEKINSTQKTQEPKSVSSQPKSSKSVNSSKQSQDSKPNGKNPDSSKPVRPTPL
ncbi:hypothetical protein Tco_1266425 [Tanacetum coccineum]